MVYRITQQQLEQFRMYLKEEEKSSATIEKYLRDVMAFTSWMGDKPPDRKSVLDYKSKLYEMYAPSSVNSVLSSINSFFEFIKCPELKVKMLKIQKNIFASKSREITKSEYNRLLDEALSKNDERLYYLMQTVCCCGIRVSEVKYITLEALKAQEGVINCKGKMRTVIIPQSLCTELDAYASRKGITNGAVFITRSGKPLDRTAIWKMMKALCDRTGISKEKVFPHNLRHLFARTYYTQQQDIVRLADILGHSSINTTRIYTRETGEIHRKQIQNLGLLRL